MLGVNENISNHNKNHAGWNMCTNAYAYINDKIHAFFKIQSSVQTTIDVAGI